MTVSARSVIFVIALACVIVCTHAGYDAGAPVGRRIIDKLFQAQPSSLAAASADSTAGNVTQGAFYVSSDLSSSSCAEQAEAEFLYGYVTNTCFPSDSGAESFVYTCSNTSVTQYVYSDGVCGTHIKSNSIAGSACVDLGDLDGDLQTDYGTLTCVSNTSVLNFTQQYILEQFYSSGKCVNSSLIEWQGVTNNTCVQGVRYTYPNVSFYGDTACEHKTTSYELRWDYCEVLPPDLYIPSAYPLMHTIPDMPYMCAPTILSLTYPIYTLLYPILPYFTPHSCCCYHRPTAR